VSLELVSLAAQDATAPPFPWSRIKRTLDSFEARFVRGGLRLQQDRVQALRPVVERALRSGLVPASIRLEGNFQDLVEVYVGQVLVEGIVQGAADVRAEERRARAAGVNLAVDGEPVVPKEAIAFIESRRDLNRFFDPDQVEKVRTILGNSLREGATVKQTMDALQTALPAASKARLENIARTEATAAYNQGRVVRFLQSKGFIQAVRFDAVLDSRVTDICEHRDGLLFALDDPRLRQNTPPLHYQCRSVLTPISGYKLEKMGGKARLDADRAKMDEAPDPQVTKKGRFGNEPWPDVQGGTEPAPAPAPTSPAPTPAVSDEVRRREDYVRAVRDAQAEVSRKRADGTATEADVRQAGEIVRREVDRRAQVLRDKYAQVERDLRAQAYEIDARRRDILNRRYGDYRAEVRGTHGYQVLDAEAERLERLLIRRDLLVDSGMSEGEVHRLLDEAKERMNEMLTSPALDAEVEAAAAEVKRLHSAADDAYASMAKASSEAFRPALGEVRELGGAIKTGARSRSPGRVAVEDSAKYLPADWIRASNSYANPLRATARARRGLYVTDGPNAGRIEVGLDNVRRPAAASHELGHRMEQVVPGLNDLCQEFLRRRTAGETPVRLKDLFPLSRYRPHETTRKDRFVHPYMGKDYGDSATEILSMGLESMYNETYNLWDYDPECADFILGVLASW
jgi:SPP1 gp7 family putative phage head morphogenesis protein